MALASIDKLRELTRGRVLESDKKGTLHTLTPKLLRRDLEKQLDLEEGDLDASEYKNAVKEAIESTMAELQSGQEEKGKKPSKAKETSPKGKKRKSGAEPEDASRGKSQPKGDIKTKKGTEQKKERVKKPVKKPTLPSDDSTALKADSAKEEGDKPKQPPAKRRKVAPAPIVGSEDEHQESSQELKPESKSTKPESARPDNLQSEPSVDNSSTHNKDIQDEDAIGPKSDSELSSLIDDPPKRKQKAKGVKDDTKPRKSDTKSKLKDKSSGSLSKDEENIKKLKSLILACGVRKVWSKVLQGLDTPSQQIKKLKEILHELGMTGRMSIEQAKAIKAKRELEQEIQDVKEFEKRVLGPSRQDTKSRGKDDEESGVETDDGDEDENIKPRRKTMNARQSIMAFLGDQSSDDN